MRYASIRKMDISNGIGIGVALFVQGCHFHCKGCFNSSTWDFSNGKEWNDEKEELFLSLASKEHVSRISLLGGEPLADENVKEIYKLILDIRNKFSDEKKIWLYTGYTFEELMMKKESIYKEIFHNIDIMVDGRFVEELRDLTLNYRGSSNQRVIDCRKTILMNELITIDTF
jgi:anaerobic ribonucleoside-triphosphate reductase activating protein